MGISVALGAETALTSASAPSQRPGARCNSCEGHACKGRRDTGTSRHTDRVDDLAVIVGGLARAGRSDASSCATAPSPALERAVFRAINDLPELAVPGRPGRCSSSAPSSSGRSSPSSPSSSAAAAWPSPPCSPPCSSSSPSGWSRRSSAANGPGRRSAPTSSSAATSRPPARASCPATPSSSPRSPASSPRTCPGRWKIVPWAARAGVDGRPGLRRRPQPARRRVRRRARHRHRRRRSTSCVAGADVPAWRPLPAADGARGRRLALTPSAVRRIAALTARSTDDRSADDAITVGSFDFAESVVLAEVYSQGLEAAGLRGRAGVRARPARVRRARPGGRARSSSCPSTPAPRPSSTASVPPSRPTTSRRPTTSSSPRSPVEPLVAPRRRAGAGRQHVRRHRGRRPSDSASRR